MKNVTITLDEETAAAVRVYAAQHGMSVSRLVGLVMQERLHDLREYNDAMGRFLAQEPFDFRFKTDRSPLAGDLRDQGRR